MKHTPTPWHVTAHLGSTGDENLSAICIAGHGQVASVAVFRKSEYMDADEERANAAHIVHCVNTHEQLVAALEDIFRVLDLYLDGGKGIYSVKEARAALAAAKK